MPIAQGDLLWYRAAEMSDAGTNGGYMSASQITDAVKNNIFDDVPQAERTTGSTKYRKVFIKVANDDDLALLTSRIFIETVSPGDDYVYFFPGTQTDQQSALGGGERTYGASTANLAITATDTTLSVLQENGSDVIFVQGDVLRISDKTTVDDGGGNVEFVTIDTGGVGAPAGDVRVLTLTAGVVNSYGQGTGTKIASVYEPGTIDSTISNIINNSGSGTFDGTEPNTVIDNIGGVEQDWTITFTSGTAYDLTGNTLGAVGSGTVSGTFAPNNADFTKPYFTMLTANWGGTFVGAETVTFTTSPAAQPIWHKRIVPAGTNSLSSNNFITAIDGESA